MDCCVDDTSKLEASTLALSGDWEGESTPYDSTKEPTLWTECALQFQKQGDVITISGGGLSRWRGEIIPYTLFGSYDVLQNHLKLSKVHNGKYTNTIEYEGSINFILPHIVGTYKSGHLSLRPRGHGHHNASSPSSHLPLPLPSDFDLCARLTGVWEGFSRRNQSDTTIWKDCLIHFSGTSSQSGSISGQGTSLWRQDVIPFLVEGVFEFDSMQGSLSKIHIGKFTNRLEFSIQINIEHCSLVGQYAQGQVELRKIGPLSAMGVNHSSSSSSSSDGLKMSLVSSNPPHRSIPDFLKPEGPPYVSFTETLRPQLLSPVSSPSASSSAHVSHAYQSNFAPVSSPSSSSTSSAPDSGSLQLSGAPSPSSTHKSPHEIQASLISLAAAPQASMPAALPVSSEPPFVVSTASLSSSATSSASFPSSSSSSFPSSSSSSSSSSSASSLSSNLLPESNDMGPWHFSQPFVVPYSAFHSFSDGASANPLALISSHEASSSHTASASSSSLSSAPPASATTSMLMLSSLSSSSSSSSAVSGGAYAAADIESSVAELHEEEEERVNDCVFPSRVRSDDQLVTRSELSDAAARLAQATLADNASSASVSSSSSSFLLDDERKESAGTVAMPSLPPLLMRVASGPASFRNSLASASVETHSPQLPRRVSHHAHRTSMGWLSNVDEMTAADPVLREQALGQYRLFLEALIVSGHLNAAQQQALNRFQSERRISESDHALVLTQLGITPQQFDAMKEEQEPTDDIDICKVCYDQKINCVLLPCGHFTLCLSCASNLDKCPVCRVRIAEAKVIYRS